MGEETQGSDRPARAWRRLAWPVAHRELLLALELLALTAVAFSRPVLEGFGESPDVFMLRGATRWDIVWFGVLVVVLPLLVAAGAGALSGVLGDRVRRAVHVGSVVVLAGVVVWRLSLEQTSWTGRARLPVLLGALVGLALGGLRWWPRTREQAATFLRFAGASASVVFLGNFVLLSDAAGESVVTGGVDQATAAQVADSLPADAPPVVMLVVDALPTSTLLNHEGEIDAELFPNFAALAGESTWYRNNTSVATFTSEALPAMLTGRYPDEDLEPVDPEHNLFSLMGAGYDMNVLEAAVPMCPVAYCGEPTTFAGQGTLLDDAVTFWREGVTVEETTSQWLPNLMLGDQRYNVARERLDNLAAELADPADKPPFVFTHTMLPHGPWEVTDEGVPYATANMPGFELFRWSGWGNVTAKQAHVLQTQAVDRLLGIMLDSLRQAGVYDDALVLVTADHGDAFIAGSSARGLDENNYQHVLWTPLLVKQPGQTRPEVDDANVQSVDVVPTIADAVGAELPWEVDGVPADRAGEQRDPGEKPAFLSTELVHHRLGEGRVEVDGEEGFARMLAEPAVDSRLPAAAWTATPYGGLLGQAVSELPAGDPVGQQVDLEVPGSFDGLSLDLKLPLEVVTTTELEEGTVVALALDGTVAGVTEVEASDPNRIHALLQPEWFVEGDNELTVHLVEGPPDDVTLRPVDHVR